MAARRRLKWSSAATSDLSNIWDYYANAASRDVADRIVRAIGDACHVLEEHPLAARWRAGISATMWPKKDSVILWLVLHTHTHWPRCANSISQGVTGCGRRHTEPDRAVHLV
ncbi:MAG: type II toxin-antitoxin system RelE/ParE family toxin [Alphaproteobacteria bacterium]|nr:type II toxin-antitoxin system RelE/ParE family toxin [Alphaproteobacteria bacterium]